MTWNEMLLDMEGYLSRYRHALEQIANSKYIKKQEILNNF